MVSPLVSLPAELKLKVLRLVLPSREPCATWPPPRPRTQIMYTCRDLYNHAYAILHRESTLNCLLDHDEKHGTSRHEVTLRCGRLDFGNSDSWTNDMTMQPWRALNTYNKIAIFITRPQARMVFDLPEFESGYHRFFRLGQQALRGKHITIIFLPYVSYIGTLDKRAVASIVHETKLLRCASIDFRVRAAITFSPEVQNLIVNVRQLVTGHSPVVNLYDEHYRLVAAMKSWSHHELYDVNKFRIRARDLYHAALAGDRVRFDSVKVLIEAWLQRVRVANRTRVRRSEVLQLQAEATRFINHRRPSADG